MGMGKKIVVIAAAVVAIGGIMGGMSYYSYTKKLEDMNRVVEVDTIYDGISINGVPVGSLTKEAAETLVKEDLGQELAEKKITLKYGDKKWELTYKDLEAEFDVASAVEKAYEVGRTGTMQERYSEILDIAKRGGENFDVSYQFDRKKIEEKVAAIAEEVKQDPKNAEAKRENGKFIISEEAKGQELSAEETVNAIAAMAESQKTGEISLVVKETEPTVTKAMWENATTLIGSYSTSFSSGAVGRNENLRVGCLNINGTVLAPGETFSMNEGLGPQTYENGYRNAAVIVNGKIEDGLAGGVCQITTTLYNAVIFAELEVKERQNHSLPVAYVPLGRDAAVAGDYKDLKFTNNTEYPVYIEAYLSDNKLICNLYGHEIHDAGRSLEFEKVYVGSIPQPPEKVKKDSSLPEGERVVTHRGQTGSKVSTYKKVFQDGKLLSREWFSDSTYSATADEVTVGTGEAKKTEPVASVEKPKEPDPVPEPKPAPEKPKEETPAPAPEPEPEPEPEVPEVSEPPVQEDPEPEPEPAPEISVEPPPGEN